MIRFILKFNILLLILLLSGCVSYKILKLERRIKIEQDDITGITLNVKKSFSAARKHSEQQFIQFTTERYLTGLDAPDPAGIIIKKGIEETLNRNYAEAEILHLEAAKLISDGSVKNNLAVIYEASGNYDAAFKMYFEALQISPYNAEFRSNFHYFLNQNYKEENEPVKTKRR